MFSLVVHSAQESVSVNKGGIYLNIEITSVKPIWQFQVMDGLSAHCIVNVNYIRGIVISLDFLKKRRVVNRDDNTRNVKFVICFVGFRGVKSE